MELLESLKEKNQLLNKDDIYYLNLENYIFSYIQIHHKEALCITLNKSIISKNDIYLLNNTLDNKFTIKLDQLALKRDTLYLIYKEKSDDIILLLSKFCQQLHELNYHSRTNCFMCGKKSDVLCYKQILVPVDDKCLKKCIEDEKEANLNDSKNFKKSILFSFLFSLLGILPALIIASILNGYSIISSILMFFPSFLAIISFYKTKLSRTLKNDLICFLIATLSLVLYHVLMIIINVSIFDIHSFTEFYEKLLKYFIESILETSFIFIVGYFSAIFLTKKRRFLRLNHLS